MLGCKRERCLRSNPWCDPVECHIFPRPSLLCTASGSSSQTPPLCLASIPGLLCGFKSQCVVFLFVCGFFVVVVLFFFFFFFYEKQIKKLFAPSPDTAVSLYMQLYRSLFGSLVEFSSLSLCI